MRCAFQIAPDESGRQAGRVVPAGRVGLPHQKLLVRKTRYPSIPNRVFHSAVVRRSKTRRVNLSSGETSPLLHVRLQRDAVTQSYPHLWWGMVQIHREPVRSRCQCFHEGDKRQNANAAADLYLPCPPCYQN